MPVDVAPVVCARTATREYGHEYDRPRVRGRVPNNESHRRSPSPQQPDLDLFGMRDRG
jgi:hypothetical protein